MSGLGAAYQPAEKFASFIVRGHALVLEIAPLGNLPFASLVSGIGVNPGQELCVAEALFGLGLERFGINSHKAEKSLIRRAGIMVFAVLSGQGSPAFIEATRENSVATKPDTRAARWMLCQIR